LLAVCSSTNGRSHWPLINVSLVCILCAWLLSLPSRPFVLLSC
jgi:hypothetical protein